MEGTLPPVASVLGIIAFVLIGLAIVGGFITLLVLADRKRRRLLAEWAAKVGFTQYDAGGELPWLRDFTAWGPGYGHKASCGYQGTHDGSSMRVFQHQSRTRNKDSETVHTFTICVAEAPVSAPKLTIVRETFGHKLVDALGAEDIDFESDEFSKKFWVKCKDRKFAYDVLHPRAMEFLLHAPRAGWEWQGNRLVLVVSGAFKPERVTPLMNNAAKFLALVPRHLERS